MVYLHAVLASVAFGIAKLTGVLSSVDRLVDGALSNVDRLIRNKVFCTGPKSSAAKGEFSSLTIQYKSSDCWASCKLVGCVKTV